MTTRTIVTRTRREDRKASNEFAFTSAMIPALDPNWSGSEFLREYRKQAWDACVRLPMPTLRDEAWRRTDLRALDAGAFRLPRASDSPGLPAAPRRLLRPLVDQAHGGQLVMQPKGIRYHLDTSLAEKGVIFTDLTTAEKQHPDKLAHIMGQIVSPDEGKFAALAAAFANTACLCMFQQE